MKVLINGDVGSFCLSEVAWRLYQQLVHPHSSASIRDDTRTLHERCRVLRRNDPRLIQVVEMLGEAANGPDAFLEIVDAPDNGWEIINVSGIECVMPQRSGSTTLR